MVNDLNDIEASCHHNFNMQSSNSSDYPTYYMTLLSKCFQNKNIFLVNIILGVLTIFLSIAGILSNLQICFTMWIYKMYKTNQGLLVMLLAVADLLISSIYMPLNAYMRFVCANPAYDQSIWCSKNIKIISDSLKVSILPMATLVLGLLSVERFWAMKYPLSNVFFK